MVPAMFWLETGRVPELLEERLAVKISSWETGVDFTDVLLGTLVVVTGIDFNCGCWGGCYWRRLTPIADCVVIGIGI